MFIDKKCELVTFYLSANVHFSLRYTDNYHLRVNEIHKCVYNYTYHDACLTRSLDKNSLLNIEMASVINQELAKP